MAGIIDIAVCHSSVVIGSYGSIFTVACTITCGHSRTFKAIALVFTSYRIIAVFAKSGLPVKGCLDTALTECHLNVCLHAGPNSDSALPHQVEHQTGRCRMRIELAAGVKQPRLGSSNLAADMDDLALRTN